MTPMPDGPDASLHGHTLSRLRGFHVTDSGEDVDGELEEEGDEDEGRPGTVGTTRLRLAGDGSPYL
jgi:hypothetical protein